MLYINVWYVGTTSSGGPSQSYGCVWRTTVVCGALRARLAPYGCVWRPSCVCWRPTGASGALAPTGASGALRAHLAPYGRQNECGNTYDIPPNGWARSLVFSSYEVPHTLEFVTLRSH
jgi:hypothetical protein